MNHRDPPKSSWVNESAIVLEKGNQGILGRSEVDDRVCEDEVDVR